MSIQSINPATEEIIEQFEEQSDSAIEAALSKADRAFRDHRQTTFSSRSKAMNEAANLLENEKDRWAWIATSEMGKTLRSAVAEVEKCAWVCRYYVEHAEAFLADESRDSDASRSFIRYLPIGPLLAVMPWNFPFWQVFRFAAPALMSGNVVLLKHASNTPRCALAIEEIFKRAGFAEGCFQSLMIGPERVAAILADSRVRAATLTGSEKAGAAVAAIAGRELKHTVLELGGSDPLLVMPSADLDAAVNAAVTARTINNGQSCIAAKRFIVHQDVYDSFEGRLVARFEGLKVGNPMEDDTDIGPLATAQGRDDLHQQVRASITRGSKQLVGAAPVNGTGYFYLPGVLSHVPKIAPAFCDELFGPVASLFRVPDLKEAIDLANATRFGLGSAIFTQDPAEIEQAVTHLDAGATFVNQIVTSDPRLPFGGVKASGYGRELSREGIHEFVNRKTVSIA